MNGEGYARKLSAKNPSVHQETTTWDQDFELDFVIGGETLKTSSGGWHEGKHDILPRFNYFISTLRLAYREFEDRAGRQRSARGSKAELIAYALETIQSHLGLRTWNGYVQTSAGR